MLFGAADYNGRRLNFTFYRPLKNGTAEEAQEEFARLCQERGYENPMFGEWSEN